MAANFDSYLDVQVDTIERPKAPPMGHYFADFNSWKSGEKNFGEGKEKTPVITVTFKLTAPDDTDEDLAAIIGDYDPAGRSVDRDYTLNDDGGMSALRTLGEITCGIDTKGLRLRDLLDACKGSPVKLALSQRAGKEEGQFFPKVDKVLKVGA